MSRRSNAKGRRTREENVREYDALIRYSSAIVLFALGVLLLISIFGEGGRVGTAVFTTSYAIVGIGAFLLPFALMAVAVYAGFRHAFFEVLTASGILIILASILSFAGLFPG